MIAVFGGTTEGKMVADFLDRIGMRYVYSTRRSSGPFPMKHGQTRQGALDETSMASFLADRDVTTVIDAAHPFAAELHRTVVRASRSLGIVPIRFDRDCSLPQGVEKGASLHRVDTFPDAIEMLGALGCKRPLASTGVESIGRLEPYWRMHDMRIRILPTVDSVCRALDQGIPPGRLVMMDPPRSSQREVLCLLAYGIDCMLCKENGRSGFLPEKVLAAKKLHLPVVVVRRPSLPEGFSIVETLDELGGRLGISRGEA
ncbi:hypothetical protein CHL67_04990 [Prosthecochloris sp. GSB1]|uniref:precorrin-6A/cobalt-precorrin-6A reductase n=1 Tax=Prosthecochloris sp. GSB1 TaxID=281093 RepID=UPI000B8C8C1A|nr:precorrin-6A/cobalt-precorrin-6A reductase [Prosthecochloris sp. GSB1]ASQ90365.1 hypothetical protein CHL67_04990 [Prosthecochloris sp. GSB1]